MQDVKKKNQEESYLIFQNENDHTCKATFTRSGLKPTLKCQLSVLVYF